ncbi:4-hydroxy-3-methylbut-2-enyl diphosphate reductase [candidate division WOR-3 bacterium JGI_Cruoil_03_51_56]|uniref:4-hydroxy-3-methylbut-2-enyl diphosphate reductase n=1 Tax=candidate division WOR-3 bacterium JGI_Cruoil_03_51_56 TaxID=1973747 RepID=A0A235BUA9_UNCW3|nr:MAG: 4-hydroxy-3-methylbut-2-enyl diphosphate reductase [candidate division WOR-3 bacterium JGI_Cruoil_03_51_56]
MPRVIIAKPTGFCFGVERAIRMAKQGKKRYGRVYTFGELVHNPLVLEELELEGIRTVRSVQQARDGTLIIRAHGCRPEILNQCRKLGIKTIDATCPYVRKVQNVARRLKEQGYLVVVVGERNHPEVRSILGYAGADARVYTPRMRVGSQKIGIVAQTTMSQKLLREAVAKLTQFRYTEVRVFDTICEEVTARQEATTRLAEKTELVIVVGGRKSANTARLAEIVKAAGKKMVFVERTSELPRDVLCNRTRIGVVAGSSTPAWVVREVAAVAKIPIRRNGNND